MSRAGLLDAGDLLARLAERIPSRLHPHIVVIGSIAAAWAYRDVSGTHAVATKDVDLLLRPAVDAVATARELGQQLIDEGWLPQFPNGIAPGTERTLDDDLPALRLSPPDDQAGWFLELLAEPLPDQHLRRRWQRFRTGLGDFGLPSFRYLPVAVHAAEATAFGLRVARPARMALAHLLEHADPDRTSISSLPGTPPRFVKDVGRAIALWWLAREQSALAYRDWNAQWSETLEALYVGEMADLRRRAAKGLRSVEYALSEAHRIALNSVLAPHGTTLDAFRRAYAGLREVVDSG